MKYSLILSICLLCAFVGQTHAFSVTNIDHKLNQITVTVYHANDTDPTPGSCWGNVGDKLAKWKINYDETYGFSKTNVSSHICVKSYVPGATFATNPLANVPGCDIQFFKTEGYENGVARASIACGYTGLCVDGKPYNYKRNSSAIHGRADLETDGFKKNCLPYKSFLPK